MGGPLEPGAAAPAFTLRDQHGAPVSPLAEAGPVVLVFFPFAFSGVCTGELRDLRARAEEFTAAGVGLYAISCDPMFALRVYADQEGITFPLLSDFWPHGDVARSYGVLDTERGCPARSTYVVAPTGAVAWAVHNPLGQAREVGAFLRAARATSAGPADTGR
jgi:peroxiredoxin